MSDTITTINRPVTADEVKKGHVYALSSEATDDSHGVYYNRDTTHVVALRDGLPASGLRDMPECYALDGSGVRTSSAQRTQFVYVEMLRTPTPEWRSLDGILPWGSSDLWTRPDIVNQETFDAVTWWTEDGEWSIPNVEGSVVDQTTALLQRLGVLPRTWTATGEAKDFVALAIRRKANRLRSGERPGSGTAFDEAAAIAAGWLSPGDKAEMEARVERFRVMAAEAREETAQARRTHQSDIATIGTRLLREANERGWCDEYDRVVSEINGSLTYEMEVRERDVEVAMTGYVRVPFTYTMTVTVSAGEDVDDAARDYADNNISGSDVRYADLDWSDAEIDDDSVEYEEQ